MFPQDQHNPFLSAHAAAARDITQWPEVPVLKLIISSRIRGQAQSAVSLYPHPGAGSWDDGGDAMNARYANSQHSHSTICCAGTHTAAIPHHTILQGELQSRAANGTSQSFTRQWPSPCWKRRPVDSSTAEWPHTPTPCSALHIYNTQSNNFKIHPNVVKWDQ